MEKSYFENILRAEEIVDFECSFHLNHEFVH